jgi:hypothetical protein
MTRTSVSNLDSNENKPYLQNIFPILQGGTYFDLQISYENEVPECPTKFFQFVLRNVKTMVHEFQYMNDEFSCFYNVDDYTEDFEKKYKMFAKLEYFREFICFFLKHKNRFEGNKYQKFIRTVLKKQNEFLEYINEYDLSSVTDIELARLQFLKNKLMISNFMIKRSLLERQ